MAADIQGLIADPQFQGLAPADKRAALSGVTKDSAFNDLGDADTLQFVSKMAERGRMTRPDLYAPPSVPRPQASMHPANFAGQPGTSYQTDEPVPTSGLGAIEYKHPVTSTLAETAGIAGVGALGAMAAPAVAAAQTFARAHPIISSMVAGEAISQARKIPYAGKFVPPYAEMLPYLIGKGKVPEGEPIPETAPEAETLGQRVPAGKFAKEVPNPNPYQFKGAPGSMDIVQSTNVGKVGYEPDSRTMTVEYKSGQVYSYHGVPQEIYKDAQDADSIGSYISRNIKGRYETVRRGSVLVKAKR